MEAIEIRPLETMEEIDATIVIQRAAWGMSDVEIVPAHVFHALQFHGASLLGAFDGDKVVGFTFGVLGTVETLTDRIDQIAAARLKMYSVIAGVLPEYQGQGIGYQLKLAQRDEALRIGVRQIAWTYDPLESLNGRFNIGKLGAISHRYIRNYHGEMSGINAGLSTDRFEVEWWVTGNRAKSRAERPWRPLSLGALLAGGAVLVNEATFNGNGLPVPPANFVSRATNLNLVEIPADFQAVKRADFDLALRWRAHTRDLFEKLFDSGYIVTDFVGHEEPDGRRRSYYLLSYQDA